MNSFHGPLRIMINWVSRIYVTPRQKCQRHAHMNPTPPFFFSQLGDLASYLVVCYYIHCIRLSPHQRDNRMIFFIGVCYHLNIFFISLLNITGLYNLAGSIRSPSSFDFFSDFPACFSSFPTSGVLRCFLYLYFYFFFSQFFFLSLRSFQSRQSCLR